MTFVSIPTPSHTLLTHPPTPTLHTRAHYPAPHSSEFKDAFALFDKKGDGKIELNQTGDVMRALGLNPSEDDVKKIVDGIDPSGTQEWGWG